MDLLLLLVILVGASVLYISRWVQTEITAALTIAALAISGILTTQQALSGFASTATLTVGAMFILSAGLLRTGALEMVTIGLARFSGGSPRRLLLLLAAVVPIASAFMNNTPVVVMMVPVILSLSEQFRIRPSKLLIPLSYLAVLGGTMTLLGTSTNILIDDLYRQGGGPGFELFTFTPLGVLFTFLGSLFIIFTSQKLLPSRAPLLGLAQGNRQKTHYISELIVEPNSTLVGQGVASVFGEVPRFTLQRPRPGRHHRRVRRHGRRDENEEDAEGKIELLELFRNERIFRGEEGNELILEAGDVLLISGTPSSITRFLEASETRLASVLEDEHRAPAQTPGRSAVETTVVEAIVLPDSPATQRPLQTLGLHRNHEVQVMGLQRRGGFRRQGLRRTRLQSGDVLLLQGSIKGLRQASQALKLLIVEGVEGSIVRRAKNRIALIIMAGVVLLAAITGAPIVILALSGAALMVLTGCLRVDEALDSLDGATLMLLVGTIPLGVALQSTGLAQVAVDAFLGRAGQMHPIILLSAFYLFTSLLTQLISNNAVAVLLTPIALQLAVSLGISPQPLLMAIAFGASASFMTPMGYQTNAIVMGPGGYTFADYLRIGVPLTLITWVMATIFIPIFWPFSG